MNEKEWREKCEVIWAMHKIMCHFNNAGCYLDWSLYGVPDGTKSIEEVMDLYENDDDFDTDYKSLTKTFCEIVASDTASILPPAAGTDFMPILKLDGGMVIV